MEVQTAPAVDAAPVAVSAPQSSAPTPPPASALGAIPVSQPQPPSESQSSGIAPAIAKLFGGAIPQPIQLNVSYRVEGNDIVTVFTDPKTGKEVAQFPPELLIGLAKFFDQQSGVTFDKNA